MKKRKKKKEKIKKKGNLNLFLSSFILPWSTIPCYMHYCAYQSTRLNHSWMVRAEFVLLSEGFNPRKWFRVNMRKNTRRMPKQNYLSSVVIFFLLSLLIQFIRLYFGSFASLHGMVVCVFLSLLHPQLIHRKLSAHYH